jgi:hypothetical protein
MPELSFAGEDHSNPMFLGRCNYLGVADRTSGLDDARHPSRGNRVEAVPEGKEGVARAGPTRRSPGGA